MSVEIPLRVVLHDEEFNEKVRRLQAKSQEFQQFSWKLDREYEEWKVKQQETKELVVVTTEAIEENKQRARESFHTVMGMMRTSYLMFSGMGRIIGGGMTMMFRTMYMVGIAAVGTYKAIAAAMAASGPAGWLQAAIMFSSLAVASTQLIAVLTGQKDLTQKMRGFNMMLHGISGMIGSYSVM